MVDTASVHQRVPTTAVHTTELNAPNVLSQQQVSTTHQIPKNMLHPSNAFNPQALGSQNLMAQTMNEQMNLAMFWNAVNFMRASQSNTQLAPALGNTGLPASANDLNAASRYIIAEICNTPSGPAHADQSTVPGSTRVPTTDQETTHSRGITRNRSPQRHGGESQGVSKRQKKGSEK